ncbi:MAG: serine/threonine-protein phosphatase [bacterium]|nr:serine/threonine-protein phosphatase [bacterium]
MQNITKIILFAGIIGVAVFALLRSSIDMNAGGPIEKDVDEMRAEYKMLSQQLGFSLDSLALSVMYEQHARYLNELKDSVNSDLTPADLNENGGHIQSWVGIIGAPEGMSAIVITPSSAYEVMGKVRFRTSNAGKVIRFDAKEDEYNPTFIQGSSAQEVAASIAGEMFGYDLEEYSMDDLSLVAPNLEIEVSTGNTIQTEDEDVEAPEFQYSWKSKTGTGGPDLLNIVLRQKVREIEENGELRTQFGYELVDFTARYELEPESLTTNEPESLTTFAIVFIGAVIILSILIFTVGTRNIFKGKVEWRRALLILISITLGYIGWRTLYYYSAYGEFMSSTASLQINLNNLISGLLVGVYGAMAYISWEAFARSQRNGQVELVDTLWQRKFFVRETGLAVIHGFGFGGILLGVFALMIYLQNTFFLQADSQFGVAEPVIKAKLLSINMSAWTTTWLIGFAQVGFVYGFCKHWIKHHWGSLAFAILFSAVFITVMGRLVGTPGTFFDDFLIYLLLSVVLMYSYQQFGIITSNTAWWLFVTVILVMPYLNSSSISHALVSWIQGGVHLAILFFGFAAYKYGVSVSEIGDYIPEYQARLAQQLRVEKEIEIARESQYQLMPLYPPKAEGLDVYGFFLPSQEVGGDYFDYVLANNEEGQPTALTMAVVDVSGKAMRAAMPAVFTSGLLLAKMKNEMPDRILTEVAEPIYNRTDKRTFITCAIARYELNTGTMIVANAGHCKPLLKRNGVADFIQTPDPKLPLGFKPDTVYGEHTFKLKKGDVFLLYSDGLPEAENEQGERYGFDAVPRLLEQIDTELLSAQEIAQEIKRTVQTYSSFKLADDTTVICLKV